MSKDPKPTYDELRQALIDIWENKRESYLMLEQNRYTHIGNVYARAIGNPVTPEQEARERMLMHLERRFLNQGITISRGCERKIGVIAIVTCLSIDVDDPEAGTFVCETHTNTKPAKQLETYRGLTEDEVVKLRYRLVESDRAALNK